MVTGMWTSIQEVCECREIGILREIISSLPGVTFSWLDLYSMMEQMLSIGIYPIIDGSSPELYFVVSINSCTFSIGKELK